MNHQAVMIKLLHQQVWGSIWCIMLGHVKLYNKELQPGDELFLDCKNSRHELNGCRTHSMPPLSFLPCRSDLVNTSLLVTLPTPSNNPPFSNWPVTPLLTPSCIASILSSPVILVLLRLSGDFNNQYIAWPVINEGALFNQASIGHTFCDIACLVLAEPSEISVFHPWHPVLVLLVVILLCGLHCD
jgi:hypothetical protein